MKLTPEYVRKFFRYDSERECLVWNADTPRLRRIGKPVSHVLLNGYPAVKVTHDYVTFHRAVWVLTNGRSIPQGYEIDHIDHDRTNYRPLNLRLVTRAENKRNAPLMKSNTSGYHGISRERDHNGWCVHIRVGGRKKRLGTFRNLDEAVTARKAAEAELGYHPNHGLR